MRRGALLGVMLCTACGPLAGFPVEERVSAQVAVLPMECRRSLGRTTTGVWACESDGPFASRLVFISRGQGDAVTIQGEHVAVAGASVWTWSIHGALAHFEQDPLTPAVLRSPDVVFQWSASSSVTRNDLRSLVAREREVVITTSVLRTIAALPSRLEVRSETPSGYSLFAHTGNSVHALLDLGSTLWAYGPTDASWAFCSYPYDSQLGITSSGACSEAPSTLVGLASGGMWLKDDEEPARFYRPADGRMTLVEGLELPPLDWVQGGVPWVIDPEDRTRLWVARVVDDRLIIDRYTASEGHTWAGANESWVWEVAGSQTIVRSR